MNPLLQKIAQQKADGIMSMNRHERRKFAKQNKIPIKIAGSTKPMNYGEETHQKAA